MSVGPDPQLLQNAVSATLAAVPPERFHRLASQMGLAQQISTQLPYAAQAMQLLELAAAKGRLNELLDLLLEANPRSKDLRDAVTRLRAPGTAEERGQPA